MLTVTLILCNGGSTALTSRTLQVPVFVCLSLRIGKKERTEVGGGGDGIEDGKKK